jgi:hypothetical protein
MLFAFLDILNATSSFFSDVLEGLKKGMRWSGKEGGCGEREEN